MDKQIREISKKRTWKRILKRSVALLCAVVMLFTMNTLKRNADTLERIAMCGYAEHVHSASCFSGDVLVCGMEEHIHTDACYQTRPSGDVEVLTIDSDEDIPVEEVDVELGDLVLDVDVGDLVLDEPGALTVNESAPTEEGKYFILGESAKVSTIIKELELGIKRKQIEAVGAIENDEEHIGLIRVDALEKDWLVSAAKDFDEAELAIVLADDIVVVKLKDGRVSEDLDTPVEEQIDIEAPAVDEQIEQTVVDEQESVIEEHPAEESVSVEEPQTDEVMSAEVQPAEEAAPVEEEQSDEDHLTEEEPEQPTEEAAPVEEEQSDEESAPVEEQPTDEAAPAEEQSDAESASVEVQPAEEDLEQPTAEAAPVEVQPAEEDLEQPTAEAASVEETAAAEEAAPAELSTDDEQQPAEDAEVTAEETAPAEGAEALAELPTDDEQSGYEQPVVPVEEQGEEGALTEEQGEVDEDAVPTEEQGEDGQQPEVVAPVDEEQGEDAAPAEEHGESAEQSEEDVQPEETAPVEEEQGEEGVQSEEVAPTEEQGEDAAPAEKNEETTPAEEQGEDAQQAEEVAPVEEEQGEDAQQPEEDAPVDEEQGEDAQQPEEATAVDEEQTEDAAPGEDYEEATSAEEEGEEGDQSEVATPADEQGEDAEQSEEAEEGQSEEQGEQLPDEQGEDAEQSEEVEAEEGQSEEQGEQLPDEQGGDAEQLEEGEAEEGQSEEQGEQLPEEQGEDAEQSEEAEEGQPEEQGEQQPEAQTYTATIDLADVETYPLSLNAMVTAATPEQEEIEEEAIDGEAQEDQAEEQTTLTIEYDEALLEVVEQDGDYLVRPVQSFESTQIIVTNGSRYELTLVNCVLKAEEQEEQSVPVHTATIDLTNATYPLSLNELITGVAPEQAESEQPEIEQSEAQNEQQVEEQPTLTIDYDEALLEIVESDGDWLVTPVQSFESTQITVTNGSRYELTLVNCALPDEAGEAAEEPEIAYPAQTFEGHTDYVKVSVTAPEGAFPEGTTMTVADVEDEKTITDIEEKVSEDFVEVKRVHAVDISFWNGETEIEPLVPISVVISVTEIEEQQDAVVVHVDNEGATEVVESQSEAPAGETELTVEMPASEAGSAPSDAGEQGAGQPAEDGDSSEEEQTEAVAFSADSFSVYAVVVTETIETKYIDAEGGTWNISVGFTKEANIPAGARLAVSEVESEDYLPEAEAALKGGKRVTMARFFDITILDEAGREVQPEVPVTVSVQLADGSDDAPQAFHFTESGPEAVETQQEDGTVVFEAESFSVYGILFTADFSCDEFSWRLTGNGQIYLSDLLEALAIDREAAEATGIVCSRPELFDIEQTESDWLLTSLMPFEGEESLTVDFRDGNIVVIRMRDAAVRAEAGERVAQCGDATITVTYTEAAGLPADVAFRAEEILPGTELYDASLNAALDKLETESGRGIDLSMVRFFDLEFSLDGVEVEPLAPVQVNIRYAEPETPATAEGESEVQTSVVHFANDTGVSVQEAMLQRAEAAERAEADGDGLPSDETGEDGLYSVEADADGLPPVESDQGEADDALAGEHTETVSAANNAEILEADVRLGDGGELLELTYAQASFSVTGTLQYYYSANTIVINGVRYEKIKISELEDGQKYVLFYTEGGKHYVLNRGLNSEPQQKYELSSGITYDVSAQWTLNIVDNNGTKRYKLSNTDTSEGTAYANPAVGVWCQTSEAYCAFEITDDGYAAKLKAENAAKYIQRNSVQDFYVGNSDSGTSFYFVKPGYDVWFDGSNGVYRGSHLHTANNKTYIMYHHGNTLYTYIDNANRVNYVKNYYESPSFEKHAITPYGTNSEVILPKLNDPEICRPYAYSDNHFQLQGWYCINTGDYYPLDPNNGDVRAQVKQDSTFYADWFPDTYDIGQNSNVFQTTDTSDFISTHMFDYNNLFNMRSLKLDSDLSHYSAYGNYDFWRENTDSLDFLFIHKGATEGTTIQPPDRGDRNSSNELNVNGNYYTGRVKTGMLTSALKDALFSHGNDIGKRYVGSANYLYKYDEATGYYYYDSDLHAAAYNQSAGRFYVYNNTIATDKSDSGDKTDFLPYNYGKDRYVEGYDEVNYWFGMESQINFFLPNSTGMLSDGEYGNHSVKGDEMVYKFSGDDDVWVLVDGQVVLDMGGVHGKVYGEINFSRGTWTVVESTDNTAAPITRDESKLLGHENHKGIIGYGDGGHVITGSLNLAEGDHTLTLYYLERGSSQSNCAIYFNLAPRYTLQFHKMDGNGNDIDQGNNGKKATFGVFLDRACTIPATGIHGKYTNVGEMQHIYETGNGGYKHITGLVAGKDYYIKELSAPAGYPDMSGEVIKLRISQNGVATITPSEGWADSMITLHSSEDAADTTINPDDRGKFLIYLGVKNVQETSVTARKVWMTLAGKEYEIDENSTVNVQLKRYYLDDSDMRDNTQTHTLRLISRYFADGSGKPVATDRGSLEEYAIASYTVGSGTTFAFNVAAMNGIGIYSVALPYGGSSSYSAYSDGRPYSVNGSAENLPTSGSFSVPNIKNDTDIYINVIGSADKIDNLMANVALNVTNVTDTATGRSANKVYVPLKAADLAGQSDTVTLSKSNGWRHKWSGLQSTDGTHTYYFEVVETGQTTPDINWNGKAFITSYSSNGLSAGTIAVNNTLDAVKVKLRKKEKNSSPRIDIPGAVFKLYTREEYNKGASGRPIDMAQNSHLLDAELDGSVTYGTGADGQPVLTSNYQGRFYTGYLPEGEYVLVETEAPYGYTKLDVPIEIKITDGGMKYRNLGASNWESRNIDANGYYNLFIDNEPKEGSIKVRKIWESKDERIGLTYKYGNLENGKEYVWWENDNGATSVLLRVGRIVDNTVVYVDASELTLTNGTVYPYNSQYIQVSKGEDGWPELTVGKLPLIQGIDRAGTIDDPDRIERCCYFVEEYGYIDATGNIHAVPQGSTTWTVDYGTVGGTVKTVAGTAYQVVEPRETNPDTLTVTNGFMGSLEFTKKDGSGHPLEGAVFQIIPNEAGEGNYITGAAAEAMLTSGVDGKVRITLPIGTYWMWEMEAPTGYRKSDALYCLIIGYPNSNMYLVEGNGWTPTDVIDNTPVGSISIAKTVQVGDVDSTELAGKSITFGLFDSQPAAESVASQTYSMTLGQTATTTAEAFTDLDMGTYWVYEVDADNHPILDGGTIIVNGKAYTVSEATPNVTLESAGDSKTVSITNNYSTIDIPVMKIWDGNSKPACVISVDFTMYTDATFNTVAKDVYGANAVVMLSSDNGWRSAFTDLPEKDSTGATIQYYLKETKVTCKVIDAATGVETTSEVTGDAITDMFGAVLGTYTGTNGDAQSVNYRTITNTRQYTDVDVEKMWDNGTWPEKVSSVQVTLKANNEAANVTADTNGNAATVTLTKATENAPNANKAAWFNLPMYDYDGNGDQITYTVEETAVTYDGTTYTSTSDVTLADIFQIATVQPTDGHATITNQLKQTTINVLKKNAETQAALPGAVFALERKSNGVYSVYGEPQTSGSNGTLSFANLPDGEYRLEETGIPAGYARTSSGMFIYFTIDQYGVTRTYDGESPILETDNSVSYVNNQFTVGNTPGVSLPSTGGSGTNIIYAVGIGMIEVAVLGLMLRRRKARDVIE